MKRNFIVNNQVGHEDLNGDIKENECKKMEVQLGVFLHSGWAKAVDYILKITALGRGGRGVLDQKETEDANRCNNNTNESKNEGPAFGKIQIEGHKAAKHH